MDSLICGIAGKASDNLKNYFRSSFIKKITDMNESEKAGVIGECMIVRCTAAMANADSGSGIMALAGMLKVTLKAARLKNAGLIIISSILADIIFAVSFGQRIGPAGAVLRCVFLFMGFACLSSDLDRKKDLAESFAIRLLKIFLWK